jgi:hypothetical protein
VEPYGAVVAFANTLPKVKEQIIEHREGRMEVARKRGKRESRAPLSIYSATARACT